MSAMVKRNTIGGASSLRRYDDSCHVHVFAMLQTDNKEPVQIGQINRELERIAGEKVTALQATKGFSYFEFSRPMITLPQEDNQPSLWHSVGTVSILYYKLFA